MFKKRNIEMYVVFLTGFIMLFFVLIQAAYKEMQYDEAYTYIYYASNFHIKDIPYYFSKSLANNHWLNTILIKMFQDLFGVKYNEYLIRIPNVIAAILYVGTVFAMYYRKHINAVVAILFLINCTLIDLFSQARGYGLAVGFIALAFMFYFEWLKEEKNNYITLALLCFTLSTFAITTGMFLYFIFCCVIIGKLLKKGELISYIKKNIPFLLIFFISELIMLKFSLNIQAGSKPVPTNSQSIFTSMFINLFSMYFSNNKVSMLLAAVFATTLLFTIIKWKNKILKTDFLVIYIGYIILLVCLKLVLKMDYPVIRLMTLTVPISLLTINEMHLIIIPHIKNQNKIKYTSMCLIIGMLVYLCYQQTNVIQSFVFKNKQFVYETAFEGKKISIDDERYNPIVEFYCNKLQNDDNITIIQN